MNIKRSSFGPFGVAVRAPVRGTYYLAWACLGETNGQGPMSEEKGTHVWFAMEKTEDLAVAKLHDELRGLMH